MARLFISDLHLCTSRPEIVDIFFRFLSGPAREAGSLYILGDLFEYWAGDDDLGDSFNTSVARALADCASGGTQIRLMHGNRDFLLGEAFARSSGVQLIADPFMLDLNGARTLLTHGDALCTDDSDYQAFRSEVRSSRWAEEFLALPLAQRKQRIEALRARSESEKKLKPPQLMDVNADAVAGMLRRHGYPRLIQGHTHRPARHEHLVDGRACERWVLPDWYQSGGGLIADGQELRFERYGR